MPEFQNILLIQLGDIGDVVLTTPTIRAVKESCPKARVSILVFKPYGSLLAADSNLYQVVEATRVTGTLFSRLREYSAFVRQLRRARYDLVIDLRTGDRGAILSYISGAPARVGRPAGSNQFWHKFLYTNILQDIEAAPPPAHPGADQSLRIVRALGIDTDDTLPKLFISAQDRIRAKELLKDYGLVRDAPWITLNPYSRWRYKEWSNDKWGKVIDQVWDIFRIPTVLIGSAEEAVAGRTIVANREDHLINLAGLTTLGELAALISMSTLHLGVDSAAPHIASAVGAATITIHGPTDWRAWRIASDQHKIVSASMPCVPCNMKGCNGSGISQCMDNLDVEPVIDAVVDFLKARLDHIDLDPL